jgi:hypothetical protein
MHFSSFTEETKWIEDDVDRETAGERKWVEDAEALVQQEQEDVKNAEKVGLMNIEPDKTFEKRMVATSAKNMSFRAE